MRFLIWSVERHDGDGMMGCFVFGRAWSLDCPHSWGGGGRWEPFWFASVSFDLTHHGHRRSSFFFFLGLDHHHHHRAWDIRDTTHPGLDVHGLHFIHQRYHFS